MISEQCQALIETTDELTGLRDLCSGVGMALEKDYAHHCATRYGESSLGFAPFGDGQALQHLAQRVLNNFNRTG
jgi:hypothetical protein